MAESMLLEFAESDYPMFPRCESFPQRSTHKQITLKIVDTLCSRFGNDCDYFSQNCLCKPVQFSRSNRICRIVSASRQLSPVFTEQSRKMCEEYKSFHNRTGKPFEGGRSSSLFVLSMIKTDVLLNNDDLALQELLLQRYGE